MVMLIKSIFLVVGELKGPLTTYVSSFQFRLGKLPMRSRTKEEKPTSYYFLIIGEVGSLFERQ